jgi:hypothetical protein
MKRALYHLILASNGLSVNNTRYMSTSEYTKS